MPQVMTQLQYLVVVVAFVVERVIWIYKYFYPNRASSLFFVHPTPRNDGVIHLNELFYTPRLGISWLYKILPFFNLWALIHKIILHSWDYAYT